MTSSNAFELQSDIPRPPLMTVERFAEWIGLPVGVCEAQADRRYWPIVVVGKRRFINVELVRKQALEAEFKK